MSKEISMESIMDYLQEISQSVKTMQMILEEHGSAIVELKNSEIIRDNNSTDSEDVKRSNISVRDKQDPKVKFSESSPKISKSEGNSFLSYIDENRRRNSLFPEPVTADVEVKRNTSLVVTAYQVDEGDKTRKLNVKSFLNLLKKYKEYKSTNADPRLNMVSFLSEEAQLDLVQDQEKKETEDSEDLDVTSIKRASDKKLYEYIAEFVRPKDKDEYRQKLWEGVTDLKRKTKGHEFNLQDYEEVFYNLVSKICGEIESIDELFRFKASEGVLKLFPLHGFGSKMSPKTANIFLQCFYPFADNFTSYVGEESLKSIRSTKDFTDLIRKANIQLARASMDVRLKTAQATPQKPLSELREKTEQQGIQRQRQYAGLQRSANIGVPTFKLLARDSAKKTERLDDSSEDEAIPDMSDDGEVLDNQIQTLMFGQQLPDRGRSADKSPKTKLPDDKRACYEYVTKGKCSKQGCTFSHDERLCRTHLIERASIYASSPLYPKEYRQHAKDLQALVPFKRLNVVMSQDSYDTSGNGHINQAELQGASLTLDDMIQLKERVE